MLRQNPSAFRGLIGCLVVPIIVANYWIDSGAGWSRREVSPGREPLRNWRTK